MAVMNEMDLNIPDAFGLLFARGGRKVSLFDLAVLGFWGCFCSAVLAVRASQRSAQGPSVSVVDRSQRCVAGTGNFLDWPDRLFSGTHVPTRRHPLRLLSAVLSSI